MVKVKHLELDGYKGWKTVRVEDITLPEFTIPAVIQHIIDNDDVEGNDPPRKSEFSLSCKGQVINRMNEENGEQFILIG